ncbi:starch synthase (maltosyl-transferring) [Propionibacterium cyclohexanicum]|uniref:Alpha-1,4-glucan:maltose-1-phosphate maltosyltransferase n=2 Tax=Propionibacterium cyclohexanicum TaxID=64702 RepID=A0A1H9R1J9_9ACTN|nr:starch synthase (maltosyl-transferring) [Propionibacterium cyclohexanicum]
MVPQPDDAPHTMAPAQPAAPGVIDPPGEPIVSAEPTSTGEPAVSAEPTSTGEPVSDLSTHRPASSSEPSPDEEPAPRHAAADDPAAQDPARTAAGIRPRRAVPRGFGRIPIHNVWPVLENGVYPAKATEGETIEVGANIFREGHDLLGATIVLTGPDGSQTRAQMAQAEPLGLDIWKGEVTVGAPGDYRFRIEAYDDRWGSWQHNALIKLDVGQDVALVCLEGRELLAEAKTGAQEAGDGVAEWLLAEASWLLDPAAPVDQLRAVATREDIGEFMVNFCPRRLLTSTREFPVVVHRRRAQFSAWYEFFPRSIGAVRHEDGSWTSGTLASSEPMLDHIASMGFDVAYIPPVNPIGRAFRKGANNALEAGPNDPGSPWAIGSPEGGHDAVNPALGTIEDFDHFVAHARELGLEVALDFALQASPDHPWVTSHPQWFTTRADGTIAYAENPPKKYQDIYPLNFDNDPAGIYAEALRLLEFWIDHGVTIFRVDNPHTKPVDFWAWLTARLHESHPDVLLQAEAFTRPEMMHALATVGFHLSYTYFTWRNTKQELGDYLWELSHDSIAFFRPNFFTNTPDINPSFTHSGNPAAFAIRTVLAATMSPAWGVYSGFELFEHDVLRPGGEEYLDSEKYEFRPRDFDAQPNLNDLMGRLNQVRHEHPALQQLRHTQVLATDHDKLFAFSKREGDDRIVVVVSLDPDFTAEGTVEIDFGALGLPAGTPLEAHDELTGADFTWGQRNYVRLWPAQPAHILTVTPVEAAQPR